MIVSGVDERLEPADDQHVDQDEHRREGDAEVAKDLVGDVPFAVPLHCVRRAVERLMRVEDLDRPAALAARMDASVRFICRMAYTGLSAWPATSPVT